MAWLITEAANSPVKTLPVVDHPLSCAEAVWIPAIVTAAKAKTATNFFMLNLSNYYTLTPYLFDQPDLSFIHAGCM